MNSISLTAEGHLYSEQDVRQKQQSMTQPLSDEKLMNEYCAGSSRAFETLYLRHKGGLYRYFLRQCSSRDIAEELFQDVWMKVVNARQNYEQTAKFTTYLYRIAHNRLVDYYRHLSSAQYAQRFEGDHQEAIDMQSEHTSAPVELEQAQLNAAVKEAVENLPFDQREAFLLQQEGHLSLADIAEISGTSRETIKSRLRYALNKLRTQLGDIQQ